ncbi:MAG: sulfotransferase [Chloroflexota bacterium]|nr:sulfotransferase [Chloroflexota bacterium]
MTRPILFVVGNSRSGTTLVGRLLGRHPDVFRFRELHFFDRFWSRDSPTRRLSPKEATIVAAGLCRRQARDVTACRAEAEALVASIPSDALTAMTVFTTYMRHYAATKGGSIPCEQTGRSVFYIDDILHGIPEARIVNIVRDPRDVLLSQKRKSQARVDVKSRALRLRQNLNYHPISTAALWVASVREADRRAGQARTHSVRFEDLLHDPATVVARIYAFCDMDFEPRVLDVPQVGSSNVPNRAGVLGIDPTRTGRWREGGLDRAEIFLCELIAGRRMRRHGYEPSGVQPDLPRLWLHLFTMSIRTGSALALHAARMDDVIGALRRRVGIS